MKTIQQELDALTQQQRKFLQKGGLCVALHITVLAKEKGLPIPPESMRTAEGGQVEGLGKARVQKILASLGITKVLAEEGGRTSRGSLLLMENYLTLLNKLHATGKADLQAALQWWHQKVQMHFASDGPKFDFDSGKSVRANLQDLFYQATEIQRNSGGANYHGAMLQHLVGAKLDLILGTGLIKHHGFSVADHSTERSADFHVNNVAIHVTTHPTEAIIRKAAANLKAGLKPLVITLTDGVSGANYLLKGTEWADRVDVLDIAQFLTANVYERSLFQAGKCKVTLQGIIERYNEIVAECETDPVLRVRF